MAAPPKPAATATMLTVNDGPRCVGFVLNRYRDGFEAFDRHDKSIGVFTSASAAAAAVLAEAAP
jgi:hypothetical protein